MAAAFSGNNVRATFLIRPIETYSKTYLPTGWPRTDTFVFSIIFYNKVERDLKDDEFLLVSDVNNNFWLFSDVSGNSACGCTIDQSSECKSQHTSLK